MIVIEDTPDKGSSGSKGSMHDVNLEIRKLQDALNAKKMKMAKSFVVDGSNSFNIFVSGLQVSNSSH